MVWFSLSVSTLAAICYKMVDGSLNANDIEKATVYMEIGNGWKMLSEQGEGYGNVSDQVIEFTRDAFKGSF